MTAPAWLKPDAPVEAAPAPGMWALVQDQAGCIDVLGVSADRARLEAERRVLVEIGEADGCGDILILPTILL